ncbi:hypothetical protein OGAPHI_001111 [Ogataea philodendri]|uniref:isoleucine--tRNA ligase n=1 Tax=Ogataea philodendri TaxID=1378263 RepID=A0A9P8TA03_9ASCO|nr:uncharacterized protein OGAPHI_001111 [Ogataea philodendri]KAH3670596.1 hypothetical protein OGAPHI_001111 [Ogataea philodendri]
MGPRIQRVFARWKSSYSATIRLPQTDFPGRTNQQLVQSVLIPQITKDLYRWNKEREVPPLEDVFILHDGPPYANGDLHIGHALNKVLKDIIVRYELLNGKYVHYRPGWDCHGLPIELKALEQIASRNKARKKEIKKLLKQGPDESLKAELEQLDSKLKPLEIIGLCKEHALKTQKSQSQQFEKMGIMGDFDEPYLTLDKQFVARQLKVFKRLFDNNLIKRQDKPVYWGCENATALAEGELEYNPQHRSTAAYVKFPVVGQDVSLLIWTSTPWTLASNRAISVNENMEYTIIESRGDKLVVGRNLVESLRKIDPDLKETDVVLPGATLLEYQYKNPLYSGSSVDVAFPVLHGDHVTDTAGTGLVHTAPGHGQDDYFLCLSHNILPYSPVNEYGKYTAELPDNDLQEFVGLRVLGEGTDKMLAKLDSLSMCYHVDGNYIHSYPYDWRSKKPIIIRSTPQWFIDVAKIKATTTGLLETQTEFVPSKGSKRLISFIHHRNEWCISRQRSWGVPIPVVYHKTTGEPLINDLVIDRISEVIANEDVESWFTGGSMAKWIPAECGVDAEDYVCGTDTMDVWFDSGTSWTLVEQFLDSHGLLPDATARGYLADVYLEGSDQHRGWFQSSVLTKIGGTAAHERPVMPYSKIITHGFTLDEQGDKMSKSLGNTIVPGDIIAGNKQKQVPSLGIDGLRLWVSQADYSSDIAVGPVILNRVADIVKKLRFTFRFLLGNISDLEQSVSYAQLDAMDRYILSKLHTFERNTRHHYKTHNYSKVVKDMNQLVNSDLSSLYFDIRKDCLYTDAADCLKRRSTQTVFVEILRVLTSVLSPIVPVMIQEVWNHAPELVTRSTESPFRAGWYAVPDEYKDTALEHEMEQLVKFSHQIKTSIDKALRSSESMKMAAEACVTVQLDPASEQYGVLAKYEPFMTEYLMVSQFTLQPAPGHKTAIDVARTALHKCPRCWRFVVDHQDALCNRCTAVVACR